MASPTDKIKQEILAESAAILEKVEMLIRTYPDLQLFPRNGCFFFGRGL